MKRIAIFPGSFDPITKGHEDIVLRAADMFDEIIVAIGINTSKNYRFDLEKRIEMIEKTFVTNSKISVDTYNALTVDYCKKVNAKYILRGLRNTNDFEYEKSISQLNQKLAPEIDTVFLITSPELASISSSIIREILAHKGDVSQFVPTNLKLE
jgi:pantetheine-phosphate adenylyltransferase